MTDTKAGRALLIDRCECGPGPGGILKHRPSWAKCPAHYLQNGVAAIEAEAAQQERERIRAAILELPGIGGFGRYRDLLAILAEPSE